MEQLLLSPIPLDTLKAAIEEIIRAELNKKQTSDFGEKLLSPAETCLLFQPKISKVTLGKWTTDGHLKSYRIGGRVYYKRSEIVDAAKTLKKYKLTHCTN